MPLIDLKSDLVWKGIRPPNFVPDEPVPNDTVSRFVVLKNSLAPPQAKIFGTLFGKSNLVQVGTKTANNAILLRDSKQDYGIASRGVQGGTGYPFPSSYLGETYNWKPNAHTGFHAYNTYENIAVPSGERTGFLEQTYLNNTPIHDVYNRFNLQQDSYNSSYIREPYILRGIQREGSIDTQRWGDIKNSAGANVPRSGPLSYADRALVDTVRIGKFLLSPKGILFLGTQAGLQLMNPNVENVRGNPRTSLENYASNTKTYLPLNTLANVASAGLGIRLPRHGVFGNVDTGTYEFVVDKSRIGDDKLTFNRLIGIWNDTIKVNTTPVGQPIRQVSGQQGPKSIFGLGVTNNIRYIDTTTGKMPDGVKISTRLKSYRDAIKSVNNYPGYNTATVQDEVSTEYPNGLLVKRLDDTITANTEEYSPGNNKGSTPGFAGATIFPDAGFNVTSPTVQRYATVAYGKLAKASGNNFVNNIDVTNLPATYHSLTGSLVNIRDTNNNGLTGDGIVKFKFKEHGTSNYTYFRAYINSINDEFRSTWIGDSLQNSPFRRYIYKEFDRNLSIDFMVAVESESELATIYSRLNTLANYTKPVASVNGPPRGTFVDITVGDLFKDDVVIIDSVSYAIDSDTPWEITDGKQVPKYVNVSVYMIYIGKNLPYNNVPIYEYNGRA